MDQLRNIMRALALISFGLIAHVLAGGGLVTGGEFFLFAVTVVALLSPNIRRGISDPAIAAVAVISQLAVHLFLGANDQMANPSSSRMYMAHCFAGVASYALIKYGEALSHLPSSVLIRLQKIEFSFTSLPQLISFCTGKFFVLFHQSTNQLRAPPLPC